MNTLYSKSDEELAQINRRKLRKFGGPSKVSLELFENLNMPNARFGIKSENNLGEMYIRTSKNRGFMVDYCLGNKVIEFFGDYWHANPKFYNENDSIKKKKNANKNIKVIDIWEQDYNRIKKINQLGYEVLIIWEYDFKHYKNETIEKSKNFLCKI